MRQHLFLRWFFWKRTLPSTKPSRISPSSRLIGKLLLAIPIVFTTAPALASEPGPLSLAGRWRFELDRRNMGLQEHWFDRRLSSEIRLPGSLPAQGIGDDVSI